MVIQEKKASWEIKVMRYDNPREKASWKIKVIKYYFAIIHLIASIQVYKIYANAYMKNKRSNSVC